MRSRIRAKSLESFGAGEGNRTLVVSLEVSGFSQCFQEPFRYFAAFWAIEITTEFLFVGMATTTLAQLESRQMDQMCQVLRKSAKPPFSSATLVAGGPVVGSFR